VWNVQSDSLVCGGNPDGEGWIFGLSFEIEEEIGLMDVIKGLPENKEIA